MQSLKLTLRVVDRCRGRPCGSMIVRINAEFPKQRLLIGLEPGASSVIAPNPQE